MRPSRGTSRSAICVDAAPIPRRCHRRRLAVPVCWYAVIMANAKRKVTYYIGEDVLRAAKVSAARTDRSDSEVVETALRNYLGFGVLDRVWARSDLTEKQAMDLAVSETHKWRRQKRAARRT